MPEVTVQNKRPASIVHYSEIQDSDTSHYEGSDELLSIGSPFGRHFGLKSLAYTTKSCRQAGVLPGHMPSRQKKNLCMLSKASPRSGWTVICTTLYPVMRLDSPQEQVRHIPSSITQHWMFACWSSEKHPGLTIKSSIPVTRNATDSWRPRAVCGKTRQ